MLAPNPIIQIYAPPEKAVQFADKVRPQDHLHHPGFYYLSAANYAADRHARVLKYAEKEPFDDYLCHSPADEFMKVDYYGIQIELFEKAKVEFLAREQKRMADMVSHNIARLKMENPVSRDWKGAWLLLNELATGYREESWTMLLEDVLWRMVECANKTGDGGHRVLAELELLSSKLTRRPGWRYNLTRCLEGTTRSGEKPVLSLRETDVIPFGKFKPFQSTKPS